MNQRFLLLVIFLLVCTAGYSQIEKNEKSGFIKLIDSLFIDHDLSNYSVRLFSNYKVKQFRVRNDEFRSRYVPNNRFGAGFGVANSKLLIDVAFNIKGPLS